MQQLIKKLLGPKSLLFLALAYTVFITIGLLLPSQGILPSQDKIPFDKLAHVVISFGLVGIWLRFFYTKERKMMSISTIYAVFGLCLLYGIIIEVLQHVLTTYRQADTFDVVANIIGLLLGVGLFRKIKDKIFN